jgi:hypothetical protein
VRGQNKEPGQFRKDQNWIGTPGCTIEQATFVPPSPLQLMDHLQAWEGYLGSDDIDPNRQYTNLLKARSTKVYWKPCVRPLAAVRQFSHLPNY